MKCNNCGAEVAEGMKFCCDCGSPLPQEKKCVSCGATIALKMKFCPECGAPQSGEAQKPKFNAAAFAMGDKNVIAGDVTSNVTNNTTINNTYEAKADAVCHVCGKTIAGGEYFTCSKCGEVTCTSCYHSLKKLCNPCFEEKKQEYRDNPVKEVSLDDSTWYSSIQEAIDDAKDGDTIKIKDGEYLEDLKINKKVTLEPFSLRDQPVLVANRRARIVVTNDAVFKDIGFRTEKNLGATNEEIVLVKAGKAKFEKCFCNYSEYTVITTSEKGTAEITDCTFSNIHACWIIDFENEGGISICKNLTFKDSSFVGSSACIGLFKSAQAYIDTIKFYNCNLLLFIYGSKNSKCVCKNIFADACDKHAFAFQDDAIAWISNFCEPKDGNRRILIQGYNNAKILLEDVKNTYKRIYLDGSSKLLVNNAEFSATYMEDWKVISLKTTAECYLFNTKISGFVEYDSHRYAFSKNDYIQEGGKLEKYFNFQLNGWWHTLESPSSISEQEYNSMLEEWREMTEIDPTGEKLKATEQQELDSARKEFYDCEGDLSSILSLAEKIYNAHPASEKVLSLYLPALAASGKTEDALKVIQKLSKDVLSAYITALDIYLTDGNMSEMEHYLEKAMTVWPESNTLKCYQAYYYLAMYKKYSDFSFLEKATAANAALKNVSGELELSHQIRLMSLLQKEAGEEIPPYDRDFCKENGLYFRIVANQKLSGVYVEGGTTSTSNSTATSNQRSFGMSFYDNSIEGFCALHIYTKTQDEYNKLKKVLLENPDLIFSEYQDKNDLANNIDNDPEIVFNEEMYGDCGDPESAIRRLTQLENDCGFKFKYKEIFAGKRASFNFILEKDDESARPYRGQWYELYDDDEVLDYWAIIDCIEDGDVYLAERNTLSSVKISIINKKTGEEIGSCPVWIETDETGDEVYQKLKDNDFYLKFLGIPIADSIEKLNAMEWKQDFYDYLKNNPSEFLSELSNEDIDVGDLSVDDLEFKVK